MSYCYCYLFIIIIIIIIQSVAFANLESNKSGHSQCNVVG